MYRPLWIEIDLAALRANFKEIKKFVGRRVGIIAILKQEAYGHGLFPLARELKSLGVEFFGLASLDEALFLRAKGFKNKILILSSTSVDYVGEFIKHKVTPTVIDYQFAKKLDQAAKKRKTIIPIHIKVDTGMGRLGVLEPQALDFIKKIKNLKNLKLEGLYTHFPSADSDKTFTKKQLKIFNRLVDKLKKQNIEFKYLHSANSMGLLNYKDSHFNLVRPGIILYGIKDSNLKIKLKPILSLKSRIIFIKKASKGSSVSYNRTFIVKKPTTIGVIACGYADGYLWSLSNKSKVLIKNKFYPTVGRVCMDYIMVDLGKNSKLKVGEIVTLIGKDKTKRITASDLAGWAKTLSYEILSRLSLKIPRIYRNSLH